MTPSTERARDTDGRGRINEIAWSPDGSRIAATVMDPIDTTRIWDSRTGEQVLTATREDYGFDWDVAFAPDGRSLAVTTKKSTVALYDFASAIWTSSVTDGGNADGLGLAFDAEDPQKTRIASSATAGGIVDGGVNLWLGDPRKPTRLATCRANVLVWNRLLAVRCLDRSTIEIWNPATRALVRRIATKGAIAWSSDGLLVVTCAQTTKAVPETRRKRAQPHVATLCRIEDARTGAVRSSVELETELRSGAAIALGARADRLAVSQNGLLQVWDLEKKTIVQIGVPNTQVKHFAWAPDGRRLAIAGRDKAMRIWEEGAPIVQMGGEP